MAVHPALRAKEIRRRRGQKPLLGPPTSPDAFADKLPPAPARPAASVAIDRRTKRPRFEPAEWPDRAFAKTHEHPAVVRAARDFPALALGPRQARRSNAPV